MSISYKSFCWSMGTTSFRTSQLNKKIEQQLNLLNNFWNKSEFFNQQWSSNEKLQETYYNYLKEKWFIYGNAARPAKDAREKTSGLVELGLIDSERKLTAVGYKILQISLANDFHLDESNILDLSKDSFLYFCQLLKATKYIDNGIARPFIILLSILNNIKPDVLGKKYLTNREFTELLPLCIDERSINIVLDAINKSRQENSILDFDSIIISVLLGMENYKEALSYFLTVPCVNKDIICIIGMNRKSRKYDIPYMDVFTSLAKLVKYRNKQNTQSFVESIKKCKKARLWQSYFFRVEGGKRLPQVPLSSLREDLPIFNIHDEIEFRREFFKIFHLLNARATLNDYADLNRRYFSLSDVIVFDDGIIQLDSLPKVFVSKISDWLINQRFTKCDTLCNDVKLQQIIGITLPDKSSLVAEATGKSLEYVKNNGGTRSVIKAERRSRFETMLNSKFPKKKVRELLSLLEDRTHDLEVQTAVTDDADLPTIFEYLVGIAWYYISDKKGDLLSFMNLSLGANFLPKTHAGGGEADIVWQYAREPDYYEEHALLLEVTLAEKENQRRMEMEPVSRHLGEYRLSHPKQESSYCTFITTNLNINVISDFRGKKNQIYYDSNDYNKHISGLKIIPIDTNMLCRLLEKGTNYKELYKIFSESDKNLAAPLEWHNDLRERINR